MDKRKGITPSLRWSVFARDNFRCRYCGKQAGEDGVELVADHVVSDKEGGDTSYDNLVTACQKCNSGKGARSLREVPVSADVVAAAEGQASHLEAMAEAIKRNGAARKALEQQVVNLKCDAYETESTQFAKSEVSTAINLIKEFGPNMVAEWYGSARRRRVSEWSAIKYVCGCAKNERADRQQTGVTQA